MINIKFEKNKLFFFEKMNYSMISELPIRYQILFKDYKRCKNENDEDSLKLAQLFKDEIFKLFLADISVGNIDIDKLYQCSNIIRFVLFEQSDT